MTSVRKRLRLRSQAARIASGARLPWLTLVAMMASSAASYERAPEHLFGVAVAVAFGRIEEVDAGLSSAALDCADGVRFVLRAPIIAADDAPKADADWRDHER